MKILHVIAGPGAGGAESYIKDLAIALKNEGHELHIGFWGQACDFGRSPEFEQLFLDELEGSGIRFFFIGYESRKFPWIGVWRIRGYVKKNNIDIYHSHFKYAIIFGALLTIPRIYTHHNIIPGANWIQYKIFNFFVDQYIGISQKCADKLIEYTGKPVKKILNAVNINKIRKNIVIRDFHETVVRCIAIGRLHPQKNYYLLFDAIAKLNEKQKNKIEVNIAGEGEHCYTDQLKEYVKKKGLEKKIRFIGNRSDIPNWLAQSHLFLMTSEWEGLPITLIEATVSGMPCIVTDVGGCAEVINICDNGIIVPPKDIERFSGAITLLVENRCLLETFSYNAGQNFSFFSIKNACQEHIDLYNRLTVN